MNCRFRPAHPETLNRLLNGSPTSVVGSPSHKNAPGRPRVFHTIVHRTSATWTAILSPWRIEGNADGKAFLIIVNVAKHGDFRRKPPPRKPTPCLNSERHIAAAVRPRHRLGNEAALTSLGELHRHSGASLPGFYQALALGWPRCRGRGSRVGRVCRGSSCKSHQSAGIRASFRGDRHRTPVADDTRRTEPPARGAGTVRPAGRHAAAPHPRRRAGHGRGVRP